VSGAIATAAIAIVAIATVGTLRIVAFFGDYCFDGLFEYWLDRTNNQQTKFKHSSVCLLEV
jgi:hypothetical protein